MIPCGDALPPPRRQITPVHKQTLEQLEANSSVYPPISHATPHFNKPAHNHRAEVMKSIERGYDTGADPPYLQSASAEPRHEVAGGLWHEDRGREGRKIIAPGGVMSKNRHGHHQQTQQQQPEQGEPTAGLSSNVIQASRKTRTGLKLRKDCWGNPIPQ